VFSSETKTKKVPLAGVIGQFGGFSGLLFIAQTGNNQKHNDFID